VNSTTKSREDRVNTTENHDRAAMWPPLMRPDAMPSARWRPGFRLNLRARDVLAKYFPKIIS
jgi:hypothetical protein